jgi:uncharacterized SAM-binding protein YcdF (DUF218 family)
MDKLKAMGAEYVRVLLAASLALFMANGVTVETLASDWKLFLNAGLAAVLPIVLRAVNPRDGEFGKVRNLED